jgi:hypothetical protein
LERTKFSLSTKSSFFGMFFCKILHEGCGVLSQIF